jgi:hypothetical protein
VELNIVNEVAVLERLSVGRLRQRFAEFFGETTNARAPGLMRVEPGRREC